ncbi:TetR/AcrR family transcriptional regulator C-terminal domain-containing protein [Actinosynnema sp. NPDC023587]|uniref:TetR/AcrR family transcriptional regulator C-terminal domain-containing protein n=1 Tax=Actinosynnema sp. NPDC023587 TaxID=3154695 RepID=UPI0033C49C2C
MTVEVFERIGSQVGALGVPRASWFNATSTLVHYILGAVGQHARLDGDTAGGPSDVDREEFFDVLSTTWRELDAENYPFLRTIVDQDRGHDDREQFLAGIAIVLDGLARLR